MRGALILAALIAVAASENTKTFTLTLGEPVNLLVVPDAIYCILHDPYFVAFNEGFGPCRIHLDRVTALHAGIWEAVVLKKDEPETERILFIIDTLPPPQVFSWGIVDHEKDEVTLHCKVNTTGELSFCKFRSQANHLFYGQDLKDEDQKYIAASNLENDTEIDNPIINSDKGIHCGLTIKEPQDFHFGSWRCGIEIKSDRGQLETVFGFLNLPNYRNFSDLLPEVPILTARSSKLRVVEDTSFSLSCRADVVLDFCFFRSPNGTLFNVESGRSTQDYEYIGDGLNAGDCGIRLRAADKAHYGTWTCNVGARGVPIQQEINVVVEGLLVSYVANQNILSITASLNSPSAIISLCRFVSASGIVLTNKVVDSTYHVTLTDNVCRLTNSLPSFVDLEPWMVGVRAEGYPNEFTQYTSRAEFGDPPSSPRPPSGGSSWSFYFVWRMFFGLLIIGFMLTLIGLMLKDTNRKWSTRRNNPNINNQNIHVPNIPTVNHNVPVPNYVSADSDPRIVDEKQNIP